MSSEIAKKGDNMPLFKHVIPKMNVTEDYAVQFNTKEGSPFVNSNQSLQSLGFDPVKDVVSLVSVKAVAKTQWQRFGTIIKRGWIYIGHGHDVEEAEKTSRKYAVLIAHFLVLFKKEGELPNQVIALDVHSMKKRKDDKGQTYLTLTRLHPKREERERLQSSASGSLSSGGGSGGSGSYGGGSSGTSGGARSVVKNTVMGVMTNVTQKVNELRGASKNVWVISGDDTGTTEALDIWFKEMSAKCANTGVRRLFGIPLEETLGIKNKRGHHIPPIISKIVSYLDHKLETEGLFRLQGSHTLVDQYRDKFELGIDVDLRDCLDPHVPATIMKQFFRELPEPLLLASNYDALIAIGNQKIPQEQKKDAIFAVLKDSLPPLNMGVLLFLLGFLNRVYRMSEINKMGLSNLATVFGPNLLRPEVDNPMLLLTNTQAINEVIQTLIQYEHDLTTLVGHFNPMAGTNSIWGSSSPGGPSSAGSGASSGSGAPTNLVHAASMPIGRARGPTTVADAIAYNQGADNTGSSFNRSPAGSSGSNSGSSTNSYSTPSGGVPTPFSMMPLSASGGATSGGSTAPPPAPLGASAPAKRARPKGGHYSSIAPLPTGQAFAGLSASDDSTFTPEQSAIISPTSSDPSINSAPPPLPPKSPRYSESIAPAPSPHQHSPSQPKMGYGNILQQSQPGARASMHVPTRSVSSSLAYTSSSSASTNSPSGYSSTNPFVGRGLSDSASSQSASSHSITSVPMIPPNFIVNEPVTRSATDPSFSPRSGGSASQSSNSEGARERPIPVNAAPPPPLEISNIRTSFAPPSALVRESQMKQLEDTVQSQKTQISNLEAEVQRLQAILQSQGISY